ncbi:YhbD family protein [Candidatus Acetothermia bacterium]|nr:YhbD family protein [Candidatus Acetothermia bacterium]
MKNEEMISKKELLAEANITYGQLYRWKRKGLIPEAWFIRKATFTGQETFFVREKILERIERIQQLKERYPLDELAQWLSEPVGQVELNQMNLHQLKSFPGIDKLPAEIMAIYQSVGDASTPYTFEQIFALAVLQRLHRAGRTIADLKLAHSLLAQVKVDALSTNNEWQLYLLRKQVSSGGISAEITLSLVAPAGTLFDPDIEVITKVDLLAILDAVKIDLTTEAI